jgi:hypothetical protein
MGTAIQNKGWKKMNAMLNEHMPVNKSRRIIWFWSVAAVGLILVAISWWSHTSNDTPTDIISDTAITSLSEVLPMDITPEMKLPFAIDSPSNNHLIERSPASSSNEKHSKTFSATTTESKINSSQGIQSQFESKINEVTFSAFNNQDSEQKITQFQDDLTPNLEKDLLLITATSPFLPASEFPTLSSNQRIEIITTSIERDKESREAVNIFAKSQVGIRSYLELSNGIQMANPSNLTQQLTLGVQALISPKWSLLAGLGIGWANMNSATDIALIGKGTHLPESSFLDGNNNFTRSYPPGTSTAQANTQYQVYSHLALGFGYRVGNVLLGAGAETAYRFIIKDGGIMQNQFNVDNTPLNAQYAGNEILELFDIYNRWDFRPYLTVSLPLTRNLSLGIQYTHGTIGVFRYPLAITERGLHRSASLNLSYQL